MNIKPEAVFYSLKARFDVSGRAWLTNKRLIFRANGRQFGSIGSMTEWEVSLDEVLGVSMPPPGRPSQRGILDIYLKDGAKHSLQFHAARPWVDAINGQLFPDTTPVT
jgi:hypothetical protein